MLNLQKKNMKRGLIDKSKEANMPEKVNNKICLLCNKSINQHSTEFNCPTGDGFYLTGQKFRMQPPKPEMEKSEVSHCLRIILIRGQKPNDYRGDEIPWSNITNSAFDELAALTKKAEITDRLRRLFQSAKVFDYALCVHAQTILDEKE